MSTPLLSQLPGAAVCAQVSRAGVGPGKLPWPSVSRMHCAVARCFCPREIALALGLKDALRSGEVFLPEGNCPGPRSQGCTAQWRGVFARGKLPWPSVSRMHCAVARCFCPREIALALGLKDALRSVEVFLPEGNCPGPRSQGCTAQCRGVFARGKLPWPSVSRMHCAVS